MKDRLAVLKRAEILSGLTDFEIEAAVKCLGAVIRKTQKNEYVFTEGSVLSSIGIVTEGQISIRKTDYYGNDNIIMLLGSADMFGESAVYSAEGRLPYNVVSEADGEILLLSSQSLIRPCCNACKFHNKIVSNLLCSVAEKNLKLTKKIDILIKRNMREKILAYLHGEAVKSGGRKLTVPLNRNQMADYLSVDRSALSRELVNMQKDGIIKFSGSSFLLL